MRWTVDPNIVWAESGGEIRLYDASAGEFQTLNHTAAAIWRHLIEKGEQTAIVSALADEFGAQDDNQRNLIASETDAFVRQLADNGLIIAQPDGAGH
jgi:hypothetical protein